MTNNITNTTSMNADEIDHAPAIAAIAAAGIGAVALGVAICAAEASSVAKSALDLYSPVGPLSGKTIFAVIIYGSSWFGLSKALAGTKPNLTKWTLITFVLLALSLILTFPPVFMAFGDH